MPKLDDDLDDLIRETLEFSLQLIKMFVIKVAFGNERVRESRCFPCGASRVQKLELNLTLLLANICRVLHYSFHDSQTHLWPRLDMRREFELGF